MSVIRILGLLAVLLLPAGCATGPLITQLPPADLGAIETRRFDADYDAVFQATIAGLQDLGYVIAIAEQGSGIITTASKPRLAFGVEGAPAGMADVVGGFSHVVSAKVNRAGQAAEVRVKIVQEVVSSWGRRDLGYKTSESTYRAGVSRVLDTIANRIRTQPPTTS